MLLVVMLVQVVVQEVVCCCVSTNRIQAAGPFLQMVAMVVQRPTKVVEVEVDEYLFSVVQVVSWVLLCRA